MAWPYHSLVLHCIRFSDLQQIAINYHQKWIKRTKSGFSTSRRFTYIHRQLHTKNSKLTILIYWWRDVQRTKLYMGSLFATDCWTHQRMESGCLRHPWMLTRYDWRWVRHLWMLTRYDWRWVRHQWMLTRCIHFWRTHAHYDAIHQI